MSTRDEDVSKIKSVFVSIGSKAALSYLATIAPWLFSNFITKKITEYFVNNVVEGIVRNSEMGVFFLFIDWRGVKGSDDFHKAVDENQLALKSGDEKRIKNAEQNLINVARPFIKLAG